MKTFLCPILAALGLFALVPAESKAITISVGQGHSDDGYYNREHGYRYYHYRHHHYPYYRSHHWQDNG
jgi:hypothetical protein